MSSDSTDRAAKAADSESYDGEYTGGGLPAAPAFISLSPQKTAPARRSGRERTERALIEAVRKTNTLYRLTDRLYAAHSLDDVYRAALQAICSGLVCERASILLHDERQVMRFVAWEGLSAGYRRAVEGHTPWAVDDPDPKPVCVENVETADLDPALRKTVVAEGIGAVAFIPLLAEGSLIGKFMAYFDRPRRFADDDIELALTIARQLAFAIERRRADEALRAGERRFREMIDALPVAIYTTDAQGRLTHFNPAAVEFSGHVPELGTDKWCVSWKLYTVDGAPLPHSECPMAVSLREGRVIRGAEAIAERPDGTRRWFAPYPTPMFDDQGKVVGGINMLLDITERKHAEQDLREREARFRAFLMATSEAIYAMSADWSEMRYLDGKDFIPDTGDPSRFWLAKYIHPDDQASVMGAIQEAIRTGSTFELEHRVIRTDGSLGWMVSRAVPLFDAQGRIKEWFGAAKDVTERKQAELLEQEQKRLLELIASGCPVDEGLEELTRSAARFQPGIRAAILLADEARSRFVHAAAADVPASFGQGVLEVPANEWATGSCGAAVRDGRPATCADIATDERGSQRWRELCLAHGILACHAEPIRGPNGQPAASFMLCLAEAREPSPWERRIAQFGGHVASIAIARRQAEEALAQQRRLYEAILTNTPDLAYIFDLEHRFIYANEGLLRMWGKTWDEAIGKTCLQLGYEPWHAEMHSREIEQVVATKQPIRGEVPFTGPLGRRIYDYLFVPVLGASGEVVAVAGTTRDVTERKETEEILRQSEERLQLVLESMPQKIFTARPDGHLDYFNPQWNAFTGLPFHQIRGEAWVKFVHPDDLDETMRVWLACVERSAAFECEHRFRSSGGEYRWHMTRALPIRNANGGTAMWIGSSTDVHDAKQLQMELRAMDRRKDEFLAMLAHELRNPLAPLSNAVHLLRRDEADDPVQREGRAIIERQTAQLTRLVDDLLEVSRITTGRIQLRRESIVVEGVVGRAVESVRSLIEQHGHGLTVSMPPYPVWLYADPARLEQVLVNLLNNAAKYTPEGASISLSSGRTTGHR